MTLLAVGVAAHLVLAAGDISVAVPAFQGTSDVPSQKRDFFVEFFSQQLASKGGLNITTPAQIAAVLGVERQKQLLGCSDGVSCLAELAGALGTEAIIIGSVAKIGSEFAITLKALDGSSSKVLTSVSVRETREEALLDALSASADQIRAALLLKLRGVQVGASTSSSSRFGARVLVPGIIGIAAGIGSGVLYGLAASTAGRLRSGDPTIGPKANADALVQTGNTEQLISAVCLGVAAVGIVAAVVLYFAFNDSPKSSLGVAMTQVGLLPTVTW